METCLAMAGTSIASLSTAGGSRWHAMPGRCCSVASCKPEQVAMGAGCRSSLSDSGRTAKGGAILRSVVSKEGRQKLNLASDREFYSFPRFVKHVDDAFVTSLTELYRERVPDGAEVLDLMSSWVSHLPADRQYKKVVGHGLNAAELARNPRLDHFFVTDLNETQELAAADCSFDAVLCAVSVQYLQQPERVFAEIYRLLRPGGVCVISFSNRMFYDKAIAAWRDGSPYSRVQLVVQYFQSVAGFTETDKVTNHVQAPHREAPWFGWFTNLFRPSCGSDPFYAVIAYRNFKPLQ